MQTVKKLFRNTYQGEDIHSLAAYKDGSWEYEKEYVPNIVNNQRFGKKAVVIGNGVSRQGFDLNILKSKKIQTYGCNALYRDFEPNFLVAVGTDIAKEIRIAGYASTHVVYSTPDNILKYPGTFHVIPQNPSWNAGALAAYLACFDGHSTVYLLGHDGIDTPGYSGNVYADTNGYKEYSATTDTFWAQAIGHVFKTYNLVDFVLVSPTGRGYMPAEWNGHTNLRRIDFRDFVLECDF
jgi:hypothetical protein